MSSEPDSLKSNPFLNRVSWIGISLGLIIIYFQLEASGLFSSPRSFVLNDGIIALLISGSLIAITSFFCMMRFKYGSWCLVDPEFSAQLRGNTSLSIKALIVAMIGFNVLSILLLLLSLPWIFKNQDKTTLYLFFGLWGSIDLVLWFVYQTIKAGERGEPTDSENTKKLLIYAVTFTGAVLLCGIGWYINRLPDPVTPLIWIVLIGIVAAIGYASLIVRRGLQTGQWLLFPMEVEEHWDTILTHYSGFLKIGILFNAIVLLTFTLIAIHLLPIDPGNFYWFWLLGILGGGNLILLIGVAVKSERMESG